MPNIPKKLSSTSFRNAVIDCWKFRIENDEKVKKSSCKNAIENDVKRQVVEEPRSMNAR